MQVTDKLKIRVSRNFAGKEPTLVIKEEKTKKTRQVKSSLCSWRDLRGSAVLFLRRSRGKSGYNFSQLDKKVTPARTPLKHPASHASQVKRIWDSNP